MCGIIGYAGTENAVPKIVGGLHALEYRGYDSAGIAVFDGSEIKTLKAKGRISTIESLLGSEHSDLYSECGIGHTRWATHGEPSDVNSHPHGTDNLMLVHNGIIENYAEIKNELIASGYSFISETDTEVAAKYIDLCYKLKGDAFSAVKSAIEKFRGSYAFGIMFRNMPNTIVCARKGSPLIIAVSEKGNYIASDIPAVLKHTNRYYTLEEGEIAFIQKHEVCVYDNEKRIVTKELQTSELKHEDAEKNGYPHYMLKEIHQEPDVVNLLFSNFTDGKNIRLFDSNLSDEKLRSFNKIKIVACGTAMHAGLIGKSAIEKLAKTPVDVEIASEFRYNETIIDKNTLVIIISQSGETADSLAALIKAKKLGAHTLAVVNVAGSSIAREADSVLLTTAGPEIAVASTKAYTVQICLMYLIAIKLAEAKNAINNQTVKEYLDILKKDCVSAVCKSLNLYDSLKIYSSKIKDTKSLFFIGRGTDYYIACEASLKLKEISYIHCESYAAGELKHGTISLITDGTPVVAVCTNDSLIEKMISNIKEVKARGAYVLMFCKEGTKIPDGIADEIIHIPCLPDIFMPIPASTVFQIFAYHTATLLDLDVDKPRNLAKSVTVE